MSTLAKLVAELNLDNSGFLKGLQSSHSGLTKYLGAAAIVGAVAGTAVALFKIGDAYDSMSDNIAVKTGATGKHLQELQSDAIDVFKTVPTTMEIAGDAISSIATKTGDTGKNLKNLTASEIELARVTKTDLNSNITASAKLFNLFGISAKDQTKTLDGLFNISQKTGVGIDQLMQETSQYAPVLKQFGLNADQSANLIGKLDKAGLNTSVIMSGMRTATKTISKDFNGDLHGGLTKVFTDIKSLGKGSAATAEAVKYFGKSGTLLAAAIADGTLSVDDLTGAVDKNGKSILDTAKGTYDFAENFALLKNNAEAFLIPLGSLVFQGLNLLIPLLTDGVKWLGTFGSAMGDAFGSSAKVSDLIKQFPDWLQPAAKALLLVADAAGDVARGFSTGGLAGAFDALGPAIKQALGALGSFALDITIDIGKWIIGKLPSLADWLDTLFGGNGATPAGDGTGGPDAAAVNHVTISTLAVDILGFAAGKVADLWGWVKGLFGVGGTSATGDGTGGPDSDRTVTLSSVMVGIAADAWNLAGSIDWAGLALKIAEGAAKGISDLVDFATPIASSVWDAIKGVDWPSVVTTDAFGAGSSFGTSVHDAIVSGVKAAVGAIKDADISASDVENVISAVGSAVISAAKAAPEIATGIAVGFASLFAGALKGLVFGDADLSAIGSNITTQISDALFGTSAAGNAPGGPQFGGGGQAATSGIVDTITGWFTGLPGKIKDSVGKLSLDIDLPSLPAWTKDAQWLSDGLSFMMSGVEAWSSVIGSAIDGVQTAFDKVKGWIEPSLPQWIHDGWSALSKALSDIEAVIERLRGDQKTVAGLIGFKPAPSSQGGGAFGMGPYDPATDGAVGQPDDPRINPVHFKSVIDQPDFGKFVQGVGDSLKSYKATLDFDTGPAAIAYTDVSTWGATFAKQTYTAMFDIDNGPAAISYTDASQWGTIWDAKTFTSSFDIDNGPAAIAYTDAFGWGEAWDGHVFTASFSIDTSALSEAETAVRNTMANIAAMLPHSPAKEGPLAFMPSFDYIHDALSSAMNRMGPTATRGMAGVSGALAGNATFGVGGTGGSRLSGGSNDTYHVTVTVTPSPGMDEEALADMVAARLTRALQLARAS